MPLPLSMNEPKTSGGDIANAIGSPLGSHAVIVIAVLVPSLIVTSPIPLRIGGSWANGP